MKIVIATKGRLTPLQRAYCLGYRRCLVRMRRELKKMVTEQFAEMQSVVDGIARDYANAKAVAKAMAERDPEVRKTSTALRRRNASYFNRLMNRARTDLKPATPRASPLAAPVAR